ncbi:MAG: FAD-dependent oxidoreductase [Pseudomonadota bacterium]
MPTRNPRYDVLFEPLQIGPKTTRNRFYQVPHCNGMGHRYPRAMAEMRGVKAEGGWGVVCTEECAIHPTSDLSPATLMRLWSDDDLPIHELMVDKVHAHDSLAGIQLVHNGFEVANYVTRLPSLAPSNIPTENFPHVHARAMTRADIREFRRWYVDAAVRAKKAGYDIIYAYAAHGTMTLLYQFMLSRYNHRSDEYGGSLENRVRLTREVLQDLKDAVGDTCAVALRFAVDELLGDSGMCHSEAQDIVGLLAEEPDLWDVNVAAWHNDSLPSRFGSEGSQRDYIAFVKQTTTKPVVGVGRFTSPDTMLSQISHGVMDLIGAARPSIADPFLPAKIDQGREADIRECIGCNMCTSGDYLAHPMRCTQNPTMGEEWRRNWHPVRIDKAGSNDKVLIVGAGPAGLEAAVALSDRGYEVIIADSSEQAGGRVIQETTLQPLFEWRRVADHRTWLLSQRANVQLYTGSTMDSDNLLDTDAVHIAIATGAQWNTDFSGLQHRAPVPVASGAQITSVEQILQGARPDGHVLVYDDDHYYMASVIAEQLAAEDCAVTLVTPESDIAGWTHNTLEHEHIQVRLRELGVRIVCNKRVVRVDASSVTLACVYIDATEKIQADNVVPVTSRTPNDALFHSLHQRREQWADAGIKSVTAIGDCYLPATIAMAVYAGHEYARALDVSADQAQLFRREMDLGAE